jgi:NUMOD3 motif
MFAALRRGYDTERLPRSSALPLVVPGREPADPVANATREHQPTQPSSLPPDPTPAAAALVLRRCNSLECAYRRLIASRRRRHRAMTHARAFIPIPVPLGSGNAVLGPVRLPLPTVTARDPAPRQRGVRRRARVRLLPCAVADPPAAIVSSPAATSLAEGSSGDAEDLAGVKRCDSLDLTAASGTSNGGDPIGNLESSDDGVPAFRIGMPHTEETKMKISAANKGKVPWNKGRKHSEETKRKIAEATRRAMMQPETRARLSSSATGRRHSSATRIKISSACVRSRAVRHDEDVQNLMGSKGERRFVIGNSLRAGRRFQLQFDWTAKVIASLNAKIHARAEAGDLRGMGSWNNGGEGSARGRRKMSLETRAKLSARIKELWADPEYRQRVSAGVQKHTNGKGRERQPLSPQHRERIRQTLLRRNAERKTESRLQSRRRVGNGVEGDLEMSRGRPDLAGTKLSGQVVDDYSEYLAARAREEERELVLAASTKEIVRSRQSKNRKVQRAQKAAGEAERRAAEQRAQDGLLLEVLAAAGQLPSLDGDGIGRFVSGLPPNTPTVFGSDGIRETGAGVMFESVNGASAAPGDASPEPLGSRLVFSSGNTVSNSDVVSGGTGAVGLFGSRNGITLDFDIYAPNRDAHDDDEDDEDDHDAGARKGGRNGNGRVSGASRPVPTASFLAERDEDDLLPGNVGVDGDSEEVIVDDDVDSVLAEVALARSSVSKISVIDDVLPLGSDDADGEEDWTDVTADDAIFDEGLDAAGTLIDGSGELFDAEDALSSDALFHEAAASLLQGRGGKRKGAEERKRVVTYVDGVAELRYVE